MNQALEPAGGVSAASALSQGRKVDGHLGILFILAIWTPYQDLGYPAFAEPLRYVLYLAVALLFVVRSRAGDWRLIAARPIAYPLFAFVTFCIASSTWSENILLSLPRALLLALTVVVCAQAVVRIGADGVARTLVTSLGIFVGLGVFAAILAPGIGTETSAEHFGKWRGLAGQKNGFGFLCVVLALLLMILPPTRSHTGGLIARDCGLLLALIGVVMSGSRGALLNLVFGVALVAVAAMPGWRVRLLVLFFAPVVLALLLAVGSVLVMPSGASMLDLEIDDNSRSVIWAFGLDALTGGRELVGFGFGGFWTDARQQKFLQMYGWVLPNFHNGYISILVETGIIGGAIFYLAIVAAGMRGLRAILRASERAILAFAIVCFVCIAQNIFENTFSRSTDIGLIVFLCASLAMWLEPRMPRPRGNWVKRNEVSTSSARFNGCPETPTDNRPA